MTSQDIHESVMTSRDNYESVMTSRACYNTAVNYPYSTYFIPCKGGQKMLLLKALINILVPESFPLSRKLSSRGFLEGICYKFLE